MYQTRTHKRSIMMLLCLMASFLGYSQDKGKLPIAPVEAQQKAMSNLNKTLQWVTPEYLEQYGFGEQEDLTAIAVGVPLYQTTFYPEAILQGREQKELNYDMVLLPLILDGSVRCFIYLMLDENGNWNVAGIGGAREAAAWSPLIRRAEKQYDHLCFLHLVQNNADYLFQPASGNYENISVGKYQQEQYGTVKSIDELYAEAVRIAKDARAITGDMSN